VRFNPSSVSKLLVRATNWIGDAVMSLPAIRAIRQVFPHAEIVLAARPWVADVYARESSIDRVLLYPTPKNFHDRRSFAAQLRAGQFDCAILLQNAFDAALIAWMAGIPERIGYRRDGRSLLLTRAIPVPEPGEIPRHERFYYFELLRRTGLIDRFPASESIQLEGNEAARQSGADSLRGMGIHAPVIGISPGAAYGTAKRWIPERFAAAAHSFEQAAPAVLVFGSGGERDVCEQVAAESRRLHMDAHNLAGQTTLKEFMDLTAACRLFLTNDSGSMHLASALGVPTVAIFGATDDTTTGPASPLARVVREQVECSPCLLRECPIDHRCMTRVSVDRVAAAGLELLEESAPAWTHETKS
jgi:heptosyltransferase-2